MNDFTNSTSSTSTTTRKPRKAKAPKNLFAILDPTYGIVDTASTKKNLGIIGMDETVVKYTLAPVVQKIKTGGLTKKSGRKGGSKAAR